MSQRSLALRAVLCLLSVASPAQLSPLRPTPPSRRPVGLAGSVSGRSVGGRSAGGRSVRPGRGSVSGRSRGPGSVAGTVLEGHSKHKTTMELITSTSGSQRQHIGVCLQLYEQHPRAYYAGWAFLILVVCGAIIGIGVSQTNKRDYEDSRR